jgi:hypothetical protein
MDAPLPYTVEIAPAAWGHLSHLSLEAYRAVLERMTSLSRLAAVDALPTPESDGSRRFLLGDLVASYEVEPRRRVLLLVTLSPAQAPSAPEQGQEPDERLSG